MRVLAFLARRFGSVFVLALAQRAETRSPYAADADATPAMAADERIHEEVVRGLAARGRARVSGTFRAAVFGANDGLVSNLALVLGVIGGGATTTTVLLTGLSGLLAGALSMGAGEFVSVRSQRELLAASVPDTRDAASVLPAPRRRRQRARAGLPRPRRGARGGRPARPRGAGQRRPRGHRDARPRRASTTGHEVVGSSLAAALSSFCFFASGAAIPVLPFLFGLPELVALAIAGRARRARAHADRRHRGRAVRRAAAAPGAAPARHRARRRGRHLLPRPALRHGYRLAAHRRTGDSSSLVTGEPSGWRSSGSRA